MNDQQFYLKVISTLGIVIPILLNLRVIRTAGLAARLFLVFLLAGLVTDLLMWYAWYANRIEYALPIFNAYSLLEALFFLWFVQHTTHSGSVRTIARRVMYGVLPFWVFCIFIYPLVLPGASRSAPFDTIYEIIVAFLAGFSLLQLTERETAIVPLARFWLLMGIFFYCFCTFFIMSLLETVLSQRIWFLNNIINLLSYAFYAVGFWKLGQNHPQRQPCDDSFE